LQGKVATLITWVYFRCTVTFSLLRPIVHVAWHKLRQCVLIRHNVIRHNIVVSLLEAVRDNVVFDDVTIASSLRSDVIILGINFIFS